MDDNKHLILDIPEAELDFSDDSWKDVVKRDFQEIRNALEKNPNNGSPAYYTWFLFFLKYGRAICSDEGRKYIKENNTSVFNLVRDAVGLEMTSGGAYTVGYKFYDECIKNSKAINAAGISIQTLAQTQKPLNIPQSDNDKFNDYLRAMRTKPFLLLAGISGTGKSRIVKQMAFDSCPDNALRSDLTSPGNYCLIEVKPNWHDSTELLGYESKINGNTYQLTPFVKFLAKAMLYPDVPFFVCLDEMNLAPVEQYFAEFLSILESRTKIDGHIVSEPLIKADIFANKDYELKLQDDLFGLELKEEVTADGSQRIISGKLSDETRLIYDELKKHGLRIPENVIVIGTVNMDETTHQFSRKVIDRAMTIEMNLPEGKDEDGNEINPFINFFANASELEYRPAPTSPSLYLATETKASEVVKALAADNAEKTEWLKGEVSRILTAVNAALEGTPFKVAYRVQNELMLYFYQLWLEDKSADWETLLNTAVDQILMMKVLPRVEGDEELLKNAFDDKIPTSLLSFCEPYPNASKKVAEMKSRLGHSQFTSFWP